MGARRPPEKLFNPLPQQWMPDNPQNQRHVGLAVAYSVWGYYQSIGNTEFLIHQGRDAALSGPVLRQPGPL